MIHKRKIKNINDAIFAIKLIIKIYKKTIPTDSDMKILIDTYNDSFKSIQNKFRSADLSLFKISKEWKYSEFHDKDQYEKFNTELIGKCEALKDFLESKTGKDYFENKTIEQRIENLEKSVEKFDQRLNYAIGEITMFNDWRTDLKEIIDWHHKTKNKKPKK